MFVHFQGSGLHRPRLCTGAQPEANKMYRCKGVCTTCFIPSLCGVPSDTSRGAFVCVHVSLLLLQRHCACCGSIHGSSMVSCQVLWRSVCD